MKLLPLKNFSLFLVLCLFVIVGATRLLSLGDHWTSDEAGWLDRSTEFMTAVEMGIFSETLVAHHPGVITVWIAALRAFFTEPHVSVQSLALARWFIGVVLLSGIGVAAVLLYRLFGCWVAVIGAAFLSFSPLFLAQSRRVHTDALAAMFVLLAVLFLLLYCGAPQKRRYLIGSGIAFGLACLAKSNALILLLWLPICFAPVSESRGNVAAVFSPRVWSGPLFPELHFTHRFRAVAPLLEPRLFDVWGVSFRRHAACLPGVTERGTSTT